MRPRDGVPREHAGRELVGGAARSELLIEVGGLDDFRLEDVSESGGRAEVSKRSR